ncbi:molecular chaperone TorD family protein [Vibrio agarivorans]|jgi:TorA maturation chaperone TorD|uniref:Molecular chaperone TorD family protein n=1 Tax=Vibrio agarivorans TaxID=153622 RepID=A0ABT7Y4Y7_9VIBR|nr:molecular chaperone TorD family protein [Vibrio agarivorans]MDN2483116.1 molecular chaperone TorD family protein [Vibrio agarivorans]MDN3659922.1 molecular chaperone TorD family protein [Vibrio agarivorans]
MTEKFEVDLDSLQTMAKVLGSLFYFPLTDANNQSLIRAMAVDAQEQESAFSDWCKTVNSELKDTLNQDFFLLFEGGEIMVAPPWGSVYLDREEVIFGDSTVAYRQFLREHGIELDTGMREPEDQFGLMLFAVSQFLEQQTDITIVKSLFADHLFPWCYRYLELVQEHALSNSYKQLAGLAQQWCEAVQELLVIEPKALKLYR